ncbi:hypothetical protein K3495_g12661 [Podosphaera aphanis]|nr:hypothetical protein K3495_g12661 [Podosphaera aphanis]
MSKNSPLIILGETDSFSRWDAALRARLAKRDLTGHVIHDDPDVDPVTRPVQPIRPKESSDEVWNDIWIRHRRQVQTWKNHETEARNIVLERLSEKVWPRDHIRLSAKDLYDSVSNTRKESASGNYIDALRQFLSIKLDSSIEDYIDKFQTAYHNVVTTAESISSSDTEPVDRSIPEATAAGVFLIGTHHVPWLSSWRDNKAIDSNDKPTNLRTMMTTLRTVAANNYQPTQNFAAAASASSSSTRLPTNRDPEAKCNKCLHVHKNKNCFRQHPELATGEKGERWREAMKRKAEKRRQGKEKLLPRWTMNRDLTPMNY